MIQQLSSRYLFRSSFFAFEDINTGIAQSNMHGIIVEENSFEGII